MKPNALNSREEEQIKLARSMTDSGIRNLLKPLGLSDLNPYQMRRLVGVLIVAQRRAEPRVAAPVPGEKEARSSDG